MLDRSSAAVTDLVLAIFRANGLLIAWGDQLAAPLGLTSARWQMLGAIALSAQPLTAPAIAAAMGVSRQGAQKQLSLLEDDGLVERAANPAHRRSPFYRLTRAGRSAYARIDERWNERAAALARAAGPMRDLATACEVVRRLIDQLDGELEDVE